MRQGQIIFHEPNEFHTVSCNNHTAPNLVVVSFVCDSPLMKFFRRKTLNVQGIERELLSTIVQEAEEAFDSLLEDPYLKGMHKRPVSRTGCEQILKHSLELLLLRLYRQTPYTPVRQLSTIKEKTTHLRIATVLNYLEEHVSSRITLADVCKIAFMCPAYLQKLFREETGSSVMDYFRSLKTKEAKRLLQDGCYNISTIADMLAYTSIHHFSKQFRQVEGMSPTEYARSIHSKNWKSEK